MKNLFWGLMLSLVISCTNISSYVPELESDLPSDEVLQDNEIDTEGGFYAEKDSWKPATKSSGSIAHAKDLPWKLGDKVMVIRLDGEKETNQWGNVNMDLITDTCTVSKASGLKCTLVSDTPLEDGVYQAVYPAYRYVGYNIGESSLSVHLSFLYELNLGLDYEHQDIVISEPISYKKGKKLTFVMKHVCALVDIDIYPPKTGNFSLLKVIADKTVFAGKANYTVNNEYNIDNIADVWYNFTTLRGKDTYLQKGEPFHTSTGLLPVQYDGMPMKIYIAYNDGTYYLSDPFPMPSLNFGVQNTIEVNNFTKLDAPMSTLCGESYMDPQARTGELLEWDMESSVRE